MDVPLKGTIGARSLDVDIYARRIFGLLDALMAVERLGRHKARQVEREKILHYFMRVRAQEGSIQTADSNSNLVRQWQLLHQMATTRTMITWASSQLPVAQMVDSMLQTAAILVVIRCGSYAQLPRRVMLMWMFKNCCLLENC